MKFFSTGSLSAPVQSYAMNASHRFPLRRWMIGFVVATVPAIFASPADALVVPSQNTTSPSSGVPGFNPNEPGWDNVNVGGSAHGNFVYLGDRWALSARHVGPETGNPIQTVTFSTGTYNIVPGTNFVIKNPTMPFSMTTDTDLRLVRLDRDPGLPTLCTTADDCAITTTTPALGSQLTFIGHGRGQIGTTTWNGHAGFNVADFATVNDIKRWGTNNLHSPASYRCVDCIFSPDKIPSTQTGVNRVSLLNTEVISFLTRYDHTTSPTSTEAQAVDKDSGSSVFYFDTGANKWLLAGNVNSIGIYSGQPIGATGAKALNGNVTISTDLSYYRTNIINTMQSYPTSLVVPGDVNLDGVLSGSIVGGVPTGDIAAFVSGWGNDNGKGVGDLSSWQAGDLNNDGKTNVADFLLMRSALNTAGLGSLASFETILGIGGGGVGVPEPSTFLMALVVAAWPLVYRRRNRRSSAGC